MWGGRPERILALLFALLAACGGGCVRVNVWEVRPERAARAVRDLTGQEPFGQVGRRIPAASGVLTPLAICPELASARDLFEEARRADLLAHGDAPWLYGRCMAVALHVLAADPDAPAIGEARALYNLSLDRVLRLTGGHVIRPDPAWPEEWARRGMPVVFARGPGLWAPERFDELRFAGDYVVCGMDHYYGSDGLGVPLMAVRRPSREEMDRRQGAERFFPYWEVYPVTALLRPGQGAGGGAWVLELHDALNVAFVPVGGRVEPLAADLTTPTAYHVARGRLERYERISFLTPERLVRQTGLHMLHPYERGKIPVVMIHGLGSSPKAWGRVVNELRGDPALRARYQFWMYMYPTGNPFLLSAAGLRQALREAREAVDPDRTDPAYDQMVLIGHSMGGLMIRLAITDSRDALWRIVSNRPVESLVAGPEDRELITQVFVFRPLPFVKRAVFIATPHRGSELANDLLGRFGDALIRIPDPLRRRHDAVVAQNEPGFFTPQFQAGIPSSIDDLEVNDPYLSALDRLPPAPWVQAHSIVGKVGGGPLETSSDRVVPYRSSHIDWAVSERVVPRSHFCQDAPETIDELRRILALHLLRESRLGVPQPPE
jgi:pimeloyl-ACP methyl ester carboxylesterase